MKFITGIFLLFLFAIKGSFAQLDTLQFEKYTMLDGLSDNITLNIIQDNDGYMWIGTVNGLNRFEGTKFQNYYQDQVPLKLVGNYIYAQKKMTDGSISAVTRKGVVQIDPRTFSTQNYVVADSTPFSKYVNTAMDVVEFKNGKRGVLTQTGFYVFNNDGSIYFRYDKYEQKDVGSRRIAFGLDIFTLNDNEILIYTDDLMSHFDLKNKKLTKIDTSNKEFAALLPDGRNWVIHKQLNRNEFLFLPFFKDSIYYYDRTKNKKTASPLNFNLPTELYWASYIFPYNDSTFLMNSAYGGIFVFYLNKETGKIRFKPGKQLAEYRCNWVYKDRENRMWIATDKGVLKEKSNPFAVKSWLYNDSKKTTKNAYFDNVLVTDDYIFITHYAREDGLFVIDAKTMELKKKISFYEDKEEWNTLTSIQRYYKDTLWLSSIPGILWLDIKNFTFGKVKLPKELIHRVLQLGALNKNGEAWMCGHLNNLAACYNTKKRSFTIYNKKTTPAFNFSRPKNMVYDSDSNLWFTGHGLSRYNFKKETFDTLITRYAGTNKFEDNILCATSDDSGSLWFHNAENGLLKYNTRTKKYEVFTMANGLPSNIITMFSPVVADHLWLASGQKLVNFNLKTKAVMVLDQNDGLPEDNFTGSEIYYDKTSGKMFAGMNNHLVSFNATINYQKVKPKSLVIDELVLKDKTVFYVTDDTLFLNYDENNATLKLHVVDFDSGTPYRFSYNLNNDEQWHKINEPVINLNNLKHGMNVIDVHARGKYGDVLKKQFVIHVSPPFWKTWWFLSLSVLLMVILIYLLIEFRLGKINKEAKLNQQLSEFELKALHAQMNPHFIFNCLNSIKALIMYNRNTEATQYLNKFSSLVRQNLDHSRKQFLTLKQNIDYIRQYIEIEAIRFKDLNYKIDVAENVDAEEVKIAPMLLQPLIENAIWHGLQTASKNKNLAVRFSNKDNRLVCEIEDNGVGINQTQSVKKKDHTSVGIENIRERIQLLNKKYDMNYSLEIIDRSEKKPNDTGTLVILSFNI